MFVSNGGMNSLRLTVARWPRQSLHECVASHVLDQLLVVLLPRPLALMYATPSLCLMPARALYPRRRPLAGVHGPLHLLLPLLQAQNHAATAIRRQGWVVAEEGMSPDSKWTS